MKKILWLPGWYPSEIEPLAGDFLQRHARAVALENLVEVIHVLRDKKGSVTSKVKKQNTVAGNLSETIIYYHSPAIALSLLDKIVSNIYYQFIYRKAIKNYVQKNGAPDCIHVHIANKNGSLALWFKKKYRVPFVVSEQWTLYMQGAKEYFADANVFFKWRWQKMMRSMSGLSVVSRALGEAMAGFSNELSFTVIPNVVDDNIFFPVQKSNTEIIKFIHVSGLDYQKNPEAMLEGFSIVKKTNPHFILDIIGPPKPQLQKLVAELDLHKQVNFHPEMRQPKLASFMQQADALLLYSRYETFGCVLIEANACGVPAIVSDIPVMHENLQDQVNGFFAESDNPQALAETILFFMQYSNDVNNHAIAVAAKEKYNYLKVGKLFSDFYAAALNKKV